MNIMKTLAVTLVAAATAFGFVAESKAATKTLNVGGSCTLSLTVNGKYVNPTLVCATSNPSGVLTYTKYRSLSSGKYFMKVTAKKSGTATIKVRYGTKYYYYYFNVKTPIVLPTPPTPQFKEITSAKYRIYSSKVANAVAYRLRVNTSSSWSGAQATSATTNPSWTMVNAKRGVYYYYWIDVKGKDGKWYGNSSRWRRVCRK